MTEERQQLIAIFQKWLDTNPRKEIIAAQCANIAEKYAEMKVKKLSLGVVAGRSEQLVCDKCGYPMFYHKPDDIIYCHGCDNTKPAN